MVLEEMKLSSGSDVAVVYAPYANIMVAPLSPCSQSINSYFIKSITRILFSLMV